MADKTPAEKLRLKPGMSVALLHLPEGLRDRLGIPADVKFVEDPAEADFVLDYASTQAEAEERLTRSRTQGAREDGDVDGVPEGLEGGGYDVSRDTIWRFAQTVGLVLNANVAIDEKLSAVRMRPL